MDRRQIGVTLTELLIAMAIVAVLATIAYPSYQDAMAKQRRASAKELMMRVAQLEARYYTENNGYTGSLARLGMASDPMPSESRGHAISISASDSDSYTIQAVPPHRGPGLRKSHVDERQRTRRDRHESRRVLVAPQVGSNRRFHFC